jgi:hypothetical protein
MPSMLLRRRQPQERPQVDIELIGPIVEIDRRRPYRLPSLGAEPGGSPTLAAPGARVAPSMQLLRSGSAPNL